MNTRKTEIILCVLIWPLICGSGCSINSNPVVFQAKSSRVDSNSSWSEQISVKTGQTIEASYVLSLTKGTWGIWFTQSGETDPQYSYSEHDSSYKGKLKYTVPRSGKYLLHIKSKDFTGSYDVIVRVIK